jgi:hypothetical protein
MNLERRDRMGQDIAKQLRSAIEELEQFLKKHPDAIKLASDILKKEQKLEAEEKPIKAPPVSSISQSIRL